VIGEENEKIGLGEKKIWKVRGSVHEE